MHDANPSILSHVSIGVRDHARSVAFYEAVLSPLGVRRVMEHDGAVAFGKAFPEFWVQTPIDGRAAGAGNGTHIAFLAPDRDAVHGFWDAALAAGATPDGEPGLRPHYAESYYACFVRDPDGHKIEAMTWDEEAEEPLSAA